MEIELNPALLLPHIACNLLPYIFTRLRLSTSADATAEAMQNRGTATSEEEGVQGGRKSKEGDTKMDARVTSSSTAIDESPKLSSNRA